MKGDLSVKRRIHSIICAFVLVAILFVGYGVGTMAVSYTPPVSNSDRTLYADELMSELLEIEISEEEGSYLRAYSDFSITTPEGLPTSNVTLNYNEADKTLTVHARDYTYTTKDGVGALWIPAVATLRGEEIPIVDNTAHFANVELSSDNTVTVGYRASFDISKEEINRIINLAYFDLPRLIAEIPEKKAEAERLRAEYLQNMAAYEEYLLSFSEYQANLALYKEYLTNKRIYDEKHEEYERYLSDLEEYNEQTAAREQYYIDLENYYKDYAKYLDYVIYADKYQAKIEAYEAYLEKQNSVKAQLGVIDALKTPVTDLNRTVYSAIMGDTVTSVIANKDAIANEVVGASAAAVDLAGEATQKLRILFEDYFSLETESDKYAYYTLNYENFRDSIIDLFISLDKLYTRKVRGILISQGKNEKYVILLAQLYCVANALSDAPVSNYDKTGYFDSSYIVGKDFPDAKSPEEILGSIYIPDTDSATPLSDGYPQPVEKTEYITMTEPTMPTPVPIPTQPTPVKEPSAIAEVKEPTEPSAVANPGDEPPEYKTPKEISDLISIGDTLTHREERKEGITYTPTLSVKRTFPYSDDVTINYYGEEYENAPDTPIYSVTVERGSYADFIGDLPTKLEDSEAIYYFSHFADKDGAVHSLSSVEKSLNLYPVFDAVSKEYEVVWVVGDKIYTENPGIPEIADEGDVYYEFIDWDYKKDAVTGNVTYTARFQKKHLLALHEGVGAHVSFDGARYVVDTRGYFETLNVSTLIERIAGKGALTLKTASGEASFSYSSVIQMLDAGVEKMKLSAIKRSEGGYIYELILLDSRGNEISPEINAQLTLTCDVAEREGFVLYSLQNGKTYVKKSVGECIVSFTAVSNTVYYAGIECTIGKIPSELAELSADKAYAAPGEYVSVSYTARKGIHVVGTYYVLRSGERIYFKDGFTMPSENVSYGIDCYREEYTVNFISDGKIIVSYVCLYGDTVSAPPDPKKASTLMYSYTFIGWSDTDYTITESKDISAQYVLTRLPDKITEGIQMTEPVLKLFVTAITVMAILMLGVLPAGIYMLVFTVLHKKKRIRVKKTQKNKTEK